MNAFTLPDLFGEGMPAIVLDVLAAGLPMASISVEGTPNVVREVQDVRPVEPGNYVQPVKPLHKLVTGVAVGASMGDSGQRQIGDISDLVMTEGVAAVYGNFLDSRRKPDVQVAKTEIHGQ